MNRPGFSQPQSTPPAYQSARPYQVSSPSAPTGPAMGPPSFSYQQSGNQVPGPSAPAGPPMGPPSFSYQQTPANGPPQGPPPGQFPGSISQSPGQGPRQSIGQPEPLYRPTHSTQGPAVAPLTQQLQGMSMAQQHPSGPPGPPGPPSFSAPSQSLTGPPYSTPPSWQTPQRRVYPEAYSGQPPSVSFPSISFKSVRFCVRFGGLVEHFDGVSK